MDLTRPVTYRGLELNDADFNGGGPIYGIVLDAVDYSDVEAVGYSEKRSMADGYDASDVFLGRRRVVLDGTVYGQNRANLYDRLQRLRYVFTPTSAYGESPGEQGYLPLNFEVPTESVVDWPTGYIPQALRVRPARLVQWAIRRDATGGEDTRGGAIAFRATLDARDPRVYSQEPVDFTDWPNIRNGSGSVCNRGDYPAPLNILIYAPAAQAAADFHLQIAGTNMHIHTEDTSAQQVIRYRGVDKVLTVQEGEVENLRMDLLTFTAGTTHPLILPGDNAFAYQSTVDIHPETHMWFWESWS